MSNPFGYERCEVDSWRRCKIGTIRTENPGDLEGAVSIAVRAADEVVDLGRITQDTLAACRTLFPQPGVLQEFVYLVAG